jgi:hypothetical protein
VWAREVVAAGVSSPLVTALSGYTPLWGLSCRDAKADGDMKSVKRINMNDIASFNRCELWSPQEGLKSANHMRLRYCFCYMFLSLLFKNQESAKRNSNSLTYVESKSISQTPYHF